MHLDTKQKSALLSMADINASYQVEPILKNINFSIKAGEQWGCLGPNGAGKSSLARIISQDLKNFSGSILFGRTLKEKGVVMVSFEEARALRARDRRLDISDFSADAFDRGTVVKDFLGLDAVEIDDANHFTKLLRIEHILSHGIRFISTGEMRKVMLGRAIFKRPGLIILDGPVDGLDTSSRQSILTIMDDLINNNCPLLVLSREAEDLPEKCSHLLILEEGSIVGYGEKATVLKDSYVKKLLSPKVPNFGDLPLALNNETQQAKNQPLIALRNVSVRYGQVEVLKDVNWVFRPGQHCHIFGPNGCGKTTLLSLILGDNHKAYGQDITLFGIRRGSGESVWDIKQNFGQVGTELHLDFSRGMSNLDVVLSGFFDSVGLYKVHQESQARQAMEWLKIFRLERFSSRGFDELSFGFQRLVLIARAMVKSPAILILDEPTLGTDAFNRATILKAIDHVAKQTGTQIIFVSHSPGEKPQCINQELHFEPSNEKFNVRVIEDPSY